MQIAVIGWGSLLWNPGELKIRNKSESDWENDGPSLPIEFSRISKDGRLTLILDLAAINVGTYWQITECSSLEEAISNLSQREKSEVNQIGYFNFMDGGFRDSTGGKIAEIIKQWQSEHPQIDAVVWTDLPSTFERKTSSRLSGMNVIKYLNSLEGEQLARAKEYIMKAPPQIRTRFRIKIEKSMGWKL